MTPDSPIPSRPRLATLKVFSLSLLALYLPVVIMGLVLFSSTNCHHCRSTWLMGGPLLPGVAVSALLGNLVLHRMPSTTPILVLGVLLQLAFLALLVLLGRRGRKWLAGSLATAFLLSLALAGLAYAIIRA